MREQTLLARRRHILNTRLKDPPIHLHLLHAPRNIHHRIPQRQDLSPAQPMPLAPSLLNDFSRIRQRQRDMSREVRVVDVADLSVSFLVERAEGKGGLEEECSAAFFEHGGAPLGG